MKKSKEITVRIEGTDIKGHKIIETYPMTVLTTYGKLIMFIKKLFRRKPHFHMIKNIKMEGE